MEIEQKKYLESLLDWCDDTYSHWERLKPRFLKQFDLRSLEEWEQSFRELEGKLRADLKEDFDYYQRAKNLRDQWIILYKESYVVQE